MSASSSATFEETPFRAYACYLDKGFMNRPVWHCRLFNDFIAAMRFVEDRDAPKEFVRISPYVPQFAHRWVLRNTLAIPVRMMFD